MSQPTHQAISARAHAIWLRRGAQAGRAIDDWLEAERELRQEAAGRPAPPRPAAATSSFAPPPSAVSPHGAPPRPPANPTGSYAPSTPAGKRPPAPTSPSTPAKGQKKKRKR